jgi:dTDP-4-dehydrorhamnose reductase
LVRVFGSSAVPLTHQDIEVASLDSCLKLKEVKPEVIINCAAYHKTDECEDNPEKTFAVNTIGAFNVAKVASEIGALNVYISTDYVFDGKKEGPYYEDDQPNPINIYGVSKFAGEVVTKNYSGRYYIARVSSLFGVAGASGKGGNFVETMITKSSEVDKLKVVNDIVMSPTFTLDAAKKIKALVEMNATNGIYHLANEGACTWYDFACTIFEILDIDVEVEPISSKEFPSKAKRPENSSLASKNKLENRSWKEALEEYLQLKGHLK